MGVKVLRGEIMGTKTMQEEYHGSENHGDESCLGRKQKMGIKTIRGENHEDRLSGVNIHSMNLLIVNIC